MKKFMRTFLNAAAIPAVAFLLAAPSQAAVNLKVHKEVLPNGLTVLLHPNSQAPTVSCRLFYVTGSVHEVPGKSGLAHILEHELFKGTKKVGIQDSVADARFMAIQDSLQALIRPAKLAGDTATVKKLTAEHDSVLNEHRKIFVKDELWSAYQAAGGTGLNAFTSDLMTAYIVTLPKNKIELFMWLESDRMQNAVLREFYSERDVVREERRMRYDDKPTGRFFETLNSMIYEAFPYRVPTIGWPSDIMNLTREMADEHYRKSEQNKSHQQFECTAFLHHCCPLLRIKRHEGKLLLMPAITEITLLCQFRHVVRLTFHDLGEGLSVDLFVSEQILSDLVKLIGVICKYLRRRLICFGDQAVYFPVDLGSDSFGVVPRMRIILSEKYLVVARTERYRAELLAHAVLRDHIARHFSSALNVV